MAATLKERYDDLRVSQGAGRARPAGISQEDPFTLKLADLILSYGVQVKASDVHIEPTGAGARIRYRIDGLLHEMLQVPKETGDPLLRAVKVKANMVTDVVGRSKPQDGRVDFEVDGRKIDLRLSSFPTLFGDVLAIRILDSSAPLLTLEQVGFPPQVLKEFQRLIRRPNGLILATGPAGSGKTTTLYAALNKLRSPHSKIITLEDPVEYQLDGIDQGQINPAVGLTFVSGLRAILRQDANVIFAGEIRDKETADIAIRAALTGHLVFSTMHTRHSLGAVTRLIDMGIELHLILASTTGVLAQRLVRLLCPRCKVPDPLAGRTFADLWKQATGAEPPPEQSRRLSKGRGCPACTMTGYQGRSGVFELLVLSEDIKRLMASRPGTHLYRNVVASGKLRTMVLDGLDKVAQGVTTLDEVLRVTGETEEG